MRRPEARAALIAAVVSGMPSTVHAILTGRDPLEATAAAGTLVCDSSRRRVDLVLAAIPIHLTISLFWAQVIVVALPRRHRCLAGTLFGVAVAYLDVGVLGRAFPKIRALPLGPQVADHAVFGFVVGYLTR